MKLLQIVYLSTLVSDEESVLKDILDECKRNNPAKGLTGMLLYTSKQFIQVLEGPETAVTDTYYRVHLDPRHSDLIELLQEPIEHRHFESWSMGFRKLNDKDAKDFPDMAPYFRYGFDVNRIKAHPGLALELLRNFAQNTQ